MKRLSQDSYKQARDYVSEKGRDIERRLLEYHFDGATKESVIEALSEYQNPDGGFGNALEPDAQAADSSAYLTTIALRILREVGATAKDGIVQRTIEYLVSSYDPESSVWPIVPAAVDSAPHATWWNFEKTSADSGRIQKPKSSATFTSFPRMFRQTYWIG